MPNSNGKVPSIIDLATKYDSQDKCIDLLEQLRWPDGVVCPKCACDTCYPIESRRTHECKDCKYQFSVTTGTVMHSSSLSLTKWILASVLLCNGRKGVSACQVARDLHVTYKTAWYLCHRLRRAMREEEWLSRFNGICEADETYIGGRARGGKRGRGAANKIIVAGVRERGGKVRMQAIPNVTSKTLGRVLKEYIDTDAEMVVADQLRSYNQLSAEFTMERINHTREYVRGNIHTNSIESIWAILKRQVNGTHHRVSKQYLPLYLSEISYRFNNREDPNLFLSVLRNGMMTDSELVRGLRESRDDEVIDEDLERADELLAAFDWE